MNSLCRRRCRLDPLHRVQRDPGPFRHHPPGPVGCLARRLGAGHRRHPMRHRLTQGRLARLAGLVAQQPIDAGLGEATLPAPDRRPADDNGAECLCHAQIIARPPTNVLIRMRQCSGG